MRLRVLHRVGPAHIGLASTWLLAALTVGVGLVDRDRLGPAAGIDWLRLALSAALLGTLGWFLASRQPTNRLGWLTLFAGLTLGVSGLGDSWSVFALAVHPTGGGVLALWLSERATAIVSLALPLLLLTFPDGRALSPLWRKIAVTSGLNAVALTMVGVLHPRPLGEESSLLSLHGHTNPTGISAAKSVLDPLLGLTFALWTASLLAGAIALVVRYRRGDAATRVQLRWVVWALVLYVGESVIPHDVWPLPAFVVETVALAALCLVMAAAILRFRLFDIDVVVNRALVYVVLSFVVIGAYVGLIGFLGWVLQARSSLTASLVATGVVAAAFSPLRARLQRSVDRVTYGDRNEPRRAFARLGERLADHAEPAELLAGIAASAAEALRLPFAQVVAADPALVAAPFGTAPADTGRLHEVPLVFNGQRVGTLVVAARDGEGRLSRHDVALLDDLGRQAVVAVRAVSLSSELGRSRERIVSAREEERRRLRRDLHDGLGPTLAGISVRAAAARRIAEADPTTAADALATIRADAQAAIAEVRRIVADLRPASLDQIGLLGALHNEANRYAPDLAVTLAAPPALPELPAAVEVAVFRIAAEALANTARHAKARHAEVALGWTGDGVLSLTVRDDGRGLRCASGRPSSAVTAR